MTTTLTDIRTDNPWMTEAQLAAYASVAGKWAKVGPPQREVCGDAAMVECFYEKGGSMWVGIEPDGYTHS